VANYIEKFRDYKIGYNSEKIGTLMRDLRHPIFILIVIVFLLQMYVMKQDAKQAAKSAAQEQNLSKTDAKATPVE